MFIEITVTNWMNSFDSVSSSGYKVTPQGQQTIKMFVL